MVRRELFAFRSRLHGCLGRRADALFELCDALLTAGSVPSPVHLSLVPVHRRGWGSFYAALEKGRIDEDTLKELLASSSPVRRTRRSTRSTSRLGRGYLYHPSRHSAGQPIVVGWAYQLVARLSFERYSWVAPVDASRVEPEEDANRVGQEEVGARVGRLPLRSAIPLFVFHAGHDPVALQQSL